MKYAIEILVRCRGSMLLLCLYRHKDHGQSRGWSVLLQMHTQHGYPKVEVISSLVKIRPAILASVATSLSLECQDGVKPRERLGCLGMRGCMRGHAEGGR